MAAQRQKRAPSFFVSHGAGPFALLGASFQQELVELSEKTRWVLDGWKGVILVTAHWATEKTHISAGPNPGVYYDYFDIEGADPLPKEAWEIKYDAPGKPDLARRIKERLEARGMEAVLDNERGWDHGVWVPMSLLRPQGDLPIVQVSIPTGGEETAKSLALGKALESFRDEGYVVLGSGHSYHNFDAVIGSIMNIPGAKPVPDNREFETKLEEVSTPGGLQKIEDMKNWRALPQSEAVHPVGKDEHFLPFLVNVAAAGADPGKRLGEWHMFGTISSSYIWA
ncbi:hypothetical protein ACJ41O_011808 [Fusarium nematophilum]